MAFFDDCDTILKIHYDYFSKGPFDENHQAIWPNLDRFQVICQDSLAIKDYGHVQAIHHQLTDDGYLKSVGEHGDLTKKVHHVTPKGFAFVINGGYKQQLKTEQEKLNLNRISANGATMGWVVAIVLGGLQLYQGNQNDKEFAELKKEISQIRLRQATDSLEIQKHLFPLQTLEQSNDTVGLPTKTTR